MTQLEREKEGSLTTKEQIPRLFNPLVEKWVIPKDEVVQWLGERQLKIDERFYDEDWTFTKEWEDDIDYTTSHAIILAKESDQFAFCLVLTKEHNENFFKPPGGKPLIGENPDRTANREVPQETGLKGLNLDRLGTINFPSRNETVALFIGVVDQNTEFSEITDPEIEEVKAFPYGFFQTELVRGKKGQADKVQATIESWLKKLHPSLSLLPTTRGT